jgi:hypothetical protein
MDNEISGRTKVGLPETGDIWIENTMLKTSCAVVYGSFERRAR